MSRAGQRSNAAGNKLAACVCLLAVLLLWAPLWASAYQAVGLACCDGAMCPVHGHTPKKTSKDVAPEKEVPVTCEHHPGTAAMNCTIVCCHNTDSTLIQAVCFILPIPPIISTPQPARDSIATAFSFWTSPVFDPAFPPPRILPV